MAALQHFLLAILVAGFCVGHFVMAKEVKKNEIFAKLTNIRCECVDATFCKFNLCLLKAISRHRTEAFVNMSILKSPIRNVMFNLAFYRKYTSYQSFPVNITVDGCKFLENTAKNPLLRQLYSFIKDSSSINHSCPFHEDALIIKKLALDRNPYFNFLPAGDYLAKLNFIISTKLRWSISFRFEFRNPTNTFLS